MITDLKLLVTIFKKDVASYHIGFKEYYYGYTITMSEYYTNENCNYSFQIGYTDATIKQIGMKKCHACT